MILLLYRYYKNHYFGSDVQWTGSYFTLVDPIGIENIDNPDMLATHHYSCLDNNNTTCGRVGYIFSDGGDSNLYYYEFSKGTNSLQDAFDEMFKNNETDSLIKTVVENWYAKYMTPYDKYIEDTIYCNDRSIYEANAFNPNGGRLDSMLKFNGFTSFNQEMYNCKPSSKLITFPILSSVAYGNSSSDSK